MATESHRVQAQRLIGDELAQKELLREVLAKFMAYASMEIAHVELRTSGSTLTVTPHVTSSACAPGHPLMLTVYPPGRTAVLHLVPTFQAVLNLALRRDDIIEAVKRINAEFSGKPVLTSSPSGKTQVLGTKSKAALASARRDVVLTWIRMHSPENPAPYKRIIEGVLGNASADFPNANSVRTLLWQLAKKGYLVRVGDEKHGKGRESFVGLPRPHGTIVV